MRPTLLIWELGGGIGHLVRLRQIADELIANGQMVYLASRNVISAGRVFAGTNVRILQAPYLATAPAYSVQTVRTFLEILNNVGFGSIQDLGSLVNAWLSLYRLIDPAVIVFDHSPTALLAAYTHSAKRVLLGTGFAAPDGESICRNLRPSLPTNLSSENIESRVIESINRVCSAQNIAPLHSAAQLFETADLNLLATFGELDHFGSREHGNYLGVFSSTAGSVPIWPKKSRLRAVGYLKPHPSLLSLVAELTRREIATLLFTGSSDPSIVKVSTEFVRLIPEPMNLRKVASEADFGLLNATHASTAELLLAGKPTIHFPLVLEQWLVGERVRQLGAGVVLTAAADRSMSSELDRALEGVRVQTGAAQFAERYRNFCSQHAVSTAAERILALAS